MQATLAKIAEILSFQLKGTTSPARPYFELAAGDRLATGWSIDSRSINPGDLFFAIKGPRHDGHEHVAAAFEKGAIAAVVSNPIAGSPGPLLEVADVQHALQTLAQWARRSWGNPIVAVTGSAGKTTTKDAIAALLSVRLRVGKTAGNLNNYLGLPLSLLRLPDEAQVGVMELGMNHAGEIRGLVQLAEPEIGVVTNVGYAHIENFSSIDGIAAAKRELIDALPLSGAAVLNADDARVLAFRDHFAGRVLTYGTSEQASVRAENITLQPGCVQTALTSVKPSSRIRSPAIAASLPPSMMPI